MSALGILGILLQVVGALVTAYGLVAAYGRARAWAPRLSDWGRGLRANFRRWLHRRQDHIISPAPAEFRFEMGTPDVRIDFAPDASLSVGERLARLEAYVKNLPNQFTSVNQHLVKLGRDIDASREAAEATAQSAIADIRTQIAGLRGELDDHQAADLRVAAAGVLISAIGTVLGLWA